MDIPTIIQLGLSSTVIIALVGLVIRITNHLRHEIDARFKSVVSRDVCHVAMGRLEDRIKEVKEDTCDIRKDVKEILQKRC